MDFKNTKKCKSCGADIPSTASYCDICGAPASRDVERQIKAREKSRARYRRNTGKKGWQSFFAKIGIVVTAIFIISFIGSAIRNRIEYKRYLEEEERRDLSGWEETVTPEEYEKLKIGMSYEEARDVIGGEGKLIRESKTGITYAWPGEYYMDKNHGMLDLDFYKDNYGSGKDKAPELSTIEENEILDGAECYETNKLVESENYSQLDAPTVNKKQVQKLEERMTYEEVCEILGGEGKLRRSRSYNYSTSKHSYKTYVWKCRRFEQDDILELEFDNDIMPYLYEHEADYIE